VRAAKSQKKAEGNFVSEWFGHRLHPTIVTTPTSISDQQTERCPFLSAAVGEAKSCIKPAKARGVCTISSTSNGLRQDWLVCPYRALNDDLVSHSVRQLFALPKSSNPFITAAVALKKAEVRDDIQARLSAGQQVFIYFDKKTSGELSIPGTDRSPEFSFDVTVVELRSQNGGTHIGRFGILEIQTMDFHGSYGAAVRNLKDALRMHTSDFADSVQENQWWLSDSVEGPNIANVFKRTFYQMMFKFQLGQHETCAGCVLAIPQAVWDSWQRHLGAPEMSKEADGTYRLRAPGRDLPPICPAWIYVFDLDATANITPSPVVLRRVIGTDAPAVSYWALDVAPKAALSNISAEFGFLAALSRRLKRFWPELAKTVKVDISDEARGTENRRKQRKKKVSI